MRLKNIDILRGIAAISVTYFHLSGSSGLSAQTANTGKWGYLGVEIFFVISGFILPYSMHKRKYQIESFFKFILKRIIRIDPAYFVTIIVSILLTIAAKQPIPNWATILSHLGYLNYILGYEAASPVFWTLAIEFQFYLLLALCFSVIANPSNVWPFLFIGIILALSFVSSPHFLPAWFSLFAMGILLFRKVVLNIDSTVYWPATITLLIFTCYNNGILEALVALLTVLFILYIKINTNTYSSKLMLWFGTISYSLYLIHWHLGRVGVAIFRHVPVLGHSEYLRLAAGMVTAVFAAWILYLLVEKPSHKLSSKIKYS